jgi:hypothetical protein
VFQSALQFDFTIFGSWDEFGVLPSLNMWLETINFIVVVVGVQLPYTKVFVD